jgi:hypothetical protein
VVVDNGRNWSGCHGEYPFHSQIRALKESSDGRNSIVSLGAFLRLPTTQKAIRATDIVKHICDATKGPGQGKYTATVTLFLLPTLVA